MTEFPHTTPPVAAVVAKRPGILAMLVRAIIPVAILGAGGVAYSIFSVEPPESTSPPAKAQAIRSRVTELRVEDYAVVVETNGIVQAHNEVSLSAEVSGRVTSVSSAFESGAYFAAGDVLVMLDERDYQTALAIAEAAHLGAESALELAVQDHDRNTKMFAEGILAVPEAAVNQSAAAKAQAAALLDSAAAQVERAKRDLERTKIRAPFEGRVRTKTVGLGQSVGVGMSLGVVFAVDFAEVRLPIAGPELQYLDLPELAADDPVDVEFRDAINENNDAVWTGKVIRTEGVLDENSLELFAIARVDDPFGRRSSQPPLRIGQPVVGSITGKVLKDVVALPRGAVRQLDQIFLVDKTDLTLSKKTIEAVWADADHIIVRDPLIEDGQLLATTSIVYAPVGAKIEIIPDIELTATVPTTTAKDDSVAK